MVFHLALAALAFTPAHPPCLRLTVVHVRPTLSMGYVPDGLSEKEWKRIREKESTQRKNLGRMGPDSKRFKSRSMKSFMESLEKGEGGHLFPVDPKKVKAGEIALKDVPYMQRRGGSWDDSDLKGARRKKWSTSDKEYAAGGFKKSQSASIFGGMDMPWTTASTKALGDAPSSEAQKMWKRMGIRTDKHGNPMDSASARHAVKGGGATGRVRVQHSDEKPSKKGLFFGLF